MILCSFVFHTRDFPFLHQSCEGEWYDVRIKRLEQPGEDKFKSYPVFLIHFYKNCITSRSCLLLIFIRVFRNRYL